MHDEGRKALERGAVELLVALAKEGASEGAIAKAVMLAASVIGGPKEQIQQPIQQPAPQREGSPETITPKEAEELGVSYPLLCYYARQGYVRTEPWGKRRKYALEDVLKERDRLSKSRRYGRKYGKRRG